MKGSVSYRSNDNRYMGRFYFLGKRYYVYGKSRTECWNKIRTKRKELQNETRTDTTISRNMNLNTWFEFWVDNFKKQEVRESTHAKIKENYNRYIKNTLGKKRIRNIDYIDVQKFINDLNAYSAKQKCMQILKEVFDLLKKEKYISKNPMNLVVMPRRNQESKVIKKTTDREVITSVEEKEILNSFKKGNILKHAIKFILYTGLRRGELLGLIWDNVDFEKNRIYIDRQFNLAVKKVTKPKTENANRYVPLLPEAREVLLKLKKTRNKDVDQVFPNIERLTQRMSYHSNRIGIHFSPHKLRHTYASRLYAAGVDPKAIQHLLGHESVDTTLNVYVHFIKEVDRDLLKNIRDFFINENVIKILD